MERRRRTILVGAVLVAVALPPAADVAARHVTERAVETGMQRELAAAQRPDVALGGTPFLTQLIGRRLRKITLDVQDATACKVRMDRLHAELRGVRRDGDSVHADAIRGEALLRYDDLNAEIAPLTLGPGPDGRLTIGAGGQFFGAQATGLARIEGGHLVIEPGDVTTTLGGQTVFGGSLEAFPPLRIPLRDMPPTLAVQVAANPDGLALAFDGADVRVDTASCPGGGTPG